MSTNQGYVMIFSSRLKGAVDPHLTYRSLAPLVAVVGQFLPLNTDHVIKQYIVYPMWRSYRA